MHWSVHGVLHGWLHGGGCFKYGVIVPRCWGWGGGGLVSLNLAIGRVKFLQKNPKNNQKGFFLMPPPQKAPLGTFSGSFFEGRFYRPFLGWMLKNWGVNAP